MGCSVAGSSHIKNNIPCEDYCGWKIYSDTVVMAVADGAGSASLGSLGAKVAVEAALQTFSLMPSDAISGAHLKLAAYNSLQGVTRHAEALCMEPSDLASTLILVAASPVRIVALQIGDGASLFTSPGGSYESCTTPPESEYANETTFLTSKNALETCQLVEKNTPVHQVAVITDGLQRIALQMPQATPFVPFFQPILQFAKNSSDSGEDELKRFLQSPRITSRTDDDLTLLIVTMSS